MHSKHHSRHLSRRAFLCWSLQVAAGACVCQPFTSLAFQPKSESLSFYHTHTHESLTINFSRLNDTEPLMKRVNYFLRDFRTSEIHPIDSRLLDLLSTIKKFSGSKGAFEVISGYRSPQTNDALRARTTGVAKNSLHMVGQAIDVRLTDLKTRTLRDIAWSMQKGGVGYYARSDFVHLDTGRIRQW